MKIGDVTLRNARNQPLLLAFLGILLAGVVALAGAFLRLTVRYGEALLRIEQLESEPRQPEQPAAEPPLSNTQLLFKYGMPPGSVATNFSMETLDGRTIQLFELRGRRAMVIFINPRCQESRAMLPALATLGPNEDILLISHSSPEENRDLMARHGVELPVLLQEKNELSRVYYIEVTPSAYVINELGQTETPRIVGAASIIGHAMALAGGTTLQPAEPTSIGNPVPPTEPLPKRGQDLPAFTVPLLTGGTLDSTYLSNQRWLLVLIDPLSPASIDLLPDLAAIHESPDAPDVVVISRRDPKHTRQLARQHAMPYLIGIQRHHDISRRLGTLATPAAYLVAEGGYLATDVAIGQQAIFALLKPLRETEQVRRTRPLASLVRRKASV